MTGKDYSGVELSWPRAGPLRATIGAKLMIEHGMVIVREVYSPSLIEDIDAAFNQKRASQEHASVQNALTAEQSINFTLQAIRAFDIEINGVVAAYRLAMPLMDMASLAMKEDCWIGTESYFRRVEPTDTADGLGLRLPFHQDQNILGEPVVNFWVPFTNCGVDAPSLELVSRRLDEIETPDRHDRNLYGQMGAEIDEELIHERYGDDLVAPVMAVGDAILFLGTTIHRTHIAPGMTKARNSVDVRVVRGRPG